MYSLDIESRLTLAWYDYAQIRWFYKGDKLQGEIQIATMSIPLQPATYSNIALFVVNSFHAPRHQHMLFWHFKDA